MRINADQYARISRLLEERAGIRLGPGKEYLVVSRLGAVRREYDMPDFEHMLRALESGTPRALVASVIDAMTTNETFWFRDPTHYEILVRDLLPALGGDRVRIWSAAASTGQEAYSIAISIQDAVAAGRLPAGLSAEILGTDISPSALRQAESARYCGMSAVRGLSPEQRQRYFVGKDDCIELQPRYRRNIRFREFNLLDSYALLGRFDVIFCRNVLIYFSPERKRDILERFAQVLNPGGGLFLGSTESMNGHEDLFEMQRYGTGLVYRRR